MNSPLERLFSSVAEKSEQFVFNIDPARVACASQGLITVSSGPRNAYFDEIASAALLAVYNVRWPSLSALVRRLHRLWVLPLAEVLRVLQAVALYERRSDVRRCIGRSVRTSLVDRVGRSAFDLIVATPGANTSPAGESSIANLPATLLARSGFEALEMHNCWECSDSRQLVALCLPPEFTDARCAPSAFAEPELPATDLHGLIERLDLFFPEHAWLFGCDMDKTLSALPTD
jgi:Bacterial type III secretion protein (HrpB4)